jgi:hypothetical protein
VPDDVDPAKGGFAAVTGKDLLIFALLIGFWYILNRYLLPKAGVST